MKVKIKSLIRPLHLGEYAAEYETETIHVWVNPPRSLRLALEEMILEFDRYMKETERINGQVEKKEQGPSEEDQQAMLQILTDMDKLGKRLYAWYAEIWSQDPDPETHWTASEVEDLVETCTDSDPQLWNYMQTETMNMINEHRKTKKKR